MNSWIFPKISNFETILMEPIDIRIITRYLIGRHHLWSIHLIGHLVRNLICRLAITHLGKLVWVWLSHMTKTLGQLRTIFKNISFGWNYFCVKSINRSWFLKTKIFHLKSFQDFQVRGSYFKVSNYHTFESEYYALLEYIWNQPMSCDYQSGANSAVCSTYYSCSSLYFASPLGGTVEPDIRRRWGTWQEIK